ncbi:MAG: PAS domain S-box protein, partial [Anaerolineales bacterium]|nr:PAS domain S-box protein [Anaerolineales bacterium]
MKKGNLSKDELRRQAEAKLNKQKKAPLKIPLRFVLVIFFIPVIILTTSIVGYIAFMNGQKTVNNVARQLRNEVSARIEEHLHNFLAAPLQVNQFNAVSIQQDWLDPKDIKRTQDYFLEQVKTQKTITSIYFGNVDGGIVGGGREGAAESFYVYNTENLKAGTFNKYAITDTGQVGKLLTSVPNLDTRTRSWYINATQKGDITWNDIYILLTGQDMTIALSSPVYDDRHNLVGVLSVEIFVSQIENFLETLKINETGQSFIMEHSGLLVASSTGENSFIKNNDKMERLDARNSQSPMIKYAAESLRERFGENYDVTTDGQFDFEINGKRYYANVSPVHDQYGIDWLIVVVIPESDFMADITITNQSTFLVTLLALGVSILVSIFVAGKIASRISYLNESTRAFTRGEGTGLISTNSRISEINELTTSFTEMELQLTQTLNDLKSEVSKRKKIGQALHESESLFRAIFEQAGVGAAQIETATGCFVRINQTYCDIVGYPRAEMEKMNFQIITHPDDLEINLANMELLKAGEIREFTMENRYFRKSGGMIWVSVTVSPMWAAGETPNYHIAILQDITTRKQTEEALRASEEKFRLAFDTSPDPIAISRLADGVIVSVNKGFLQVSGYTQEEVIGKVASEINSWKDPEDRRKFVEEMQSRGEVRNYEARLLTSSSEIYGLMSASIINFCGEPHVLATTRDITERKQAEEALHESEERFRVIFEKANDAIHIENTDNQILAVNSRMCELMGYSREELLKMHVADLQAPEMRQPGNVLKNELAQHGSAIFEGLNLHRDGRRIQVEISIGRIELPSGDLYVSVLRDITERKQAETALQQAEAKNRNIFENTMDGIFQTTPAGKFFTANPALAHMLGYDSPEELIAGLNNLNSEFYVQPARREEFIRLLSDDGMISNFESEVHRKDGSTIWISENAKTVCNDLGQILYYEGTL